MLKTVVLEGNFDSLYKLENGVEEKHNRLKFHLGLVLAERKTLVVAFETFRVMKNYEMEVGNSKKRKLGAVQRTLVVVEFGLNGNLEYVAGFE